jgi:hypothetical protein
VRAKFRSLAFGLLLPLLALALFLITGAPAVVQRTEPNRAFASDTGVEAADAAGTLPTGVSARPRTI